MAVSGVCSGVLEENSGKVLSFPYGAIHSSCGALRPPYGHLLIAYLPVGPEAFHYQVFGVSMISGFRDLYDIRFSGSL